MNGATGFPRRRLRPAPPAIVCAALGVALAGPSWADRHCFPASDRYYMARHALMTDASDPQATVARAIDNIGAAAAEAAICGCDDIREVLQALHDLVDDPGLAVDLVIERTLSAEADVKDALEACHG